MDVETKSESETSILTSQDRSELEKANTIAAELHWTNLNWTELRPRGIQPGKEQQQEEEEEEEEEEEGKESEL